MHHHENGGTNMSESVAQSVEHRPFKAVVPGSSPGRLTILSHLIQLQLEPFMSIQRYGVALILSGPSGSGKSSISKEIMRKYPEITFSISCTTRQPRGTEKNGVEYYFITREEFRKKIEGDLFIEYAEVHGNYYGTLKSEVLDRVAKGIDVILDIDVQGAEKVRELCRKDEMFEKCTEFVFVAPPSCQELERRLRGRGTDAEEVILKRLSNSKQELARWKEYSYLLINDDFESAVERFNALLLAFRMSTKRLRGDIYA